MQDAVPEVPVSADIWNREEVKSVNKQKSKKKTTTSAEIKSTIDEKVFDEKNDRLESIPSVNPFSEFVRPRNGKKWRAKLEFIVETSNKFESLRIENENVIDDEGSFSRLKNLEEVEDQNLKLEKNIRMKKGEKKTNKTQNIDL